MLYLATGLVKIVEQAYDDHRKLGRKQAAWDTETAASLHADNEEIKKLLTELRIEVARKP